MNATRDWIAIVAPIRRRALTVKSWARTDVALEAQSVADDAYRARVSSERGAETYCLIEDEAIRARDELVRVLEHCGVRFDDETFGELLGVTIGLASAAAVAAVTLLSVDRANGA